MINGLVLAGGKSSRMGLDKAMINYHGQPQREYLFDLLKNFCDEVYLSCKNNDNTPASLNPLSDQYEIESPLNGILTAFKKDPNAVWLAIAVDMPLVDSETIKYLIKNRDSNKVATCFKDSDDEKPEPLFTIWEPHAFPLLLDFYNNGKISPRSFLQGHEILLLDVPDKKILTNINSPEDLNKFRK
jgi:molybdopterin-guanine dinucleotide biosynthesis protein A